MFQHTRTHTQIKKNLSDAFFKVAQFIVFNGMPDRCVLNCLSALAWNVSLITYQILNFQMRLHFDNQLFKKKFFYTSNVCTSPNWQSAPTLQAKNAHFPSLTRTAPLSLIDTWIRVKLASAQSLLELPLWPSKPGIPQRRVIWCEGMLD